MICISWCHPGAGGGGAGALPQQGGLSTPSCGRATCLPPQDGAACHPSISTVSSPYLLLKSMFTAFSLFIILWWPTVRQQCSGLWKAYSQFIESVTVTPFSRERRPAFMKLESLPCKLQSYAKQQHGTSQFNNFCRQRGHAAQRMTVLLLLLKIVGRFVLHSNSCSSLCIVPVKRNICRGLLPRCEVFGWILLAQQSELHFKYCWLNLALTGATYWAVTEYVLNRSPFTVPNSLSPSRPARQKSMVCSVWQGMQRRNFVGFCFSRVIQA